MACALIWEVMELAVAYLMGISTEMQHLVHKHERWTVSRARGSTTVHCRECISLVKMWMLLTILIKTDQALFSNILPSFPSFLIFSLHSTFRMTSPALLFKKTLNEFLTLHTLLFVCLQRHPFSNRMAFSVPFFSEKSRWSYTEIFRVDAYPDFL